MYVYDIKENNMAKRLTQYEIEAILGQVVSEIEASKEDLVKTPDVVKMEAKAVADKARLTKLREELRTLEDEIQETHSEFARKKGLSINVWDFNNGRNPDQYYTLDNEVSYTTKNQIRNQIILSGLKLENIDDLIGDLVKKFSK